MYTLETPEVISEPALVATVSSAAKDKPVTDLSRLSYPVGSTVIPNPPRSLRLPVSDLKAKTSFVNSALAS